MSSAGLTQSERLFEELCCGQGAGARRLPPLADSKQPDYEVSLGSDRIVVEVKQLNPNAEDLEITRRIEAGTGGIYGGDPNDMAERVRNHIKSSRRQFKAYLQRHPGTPAILVLFNATGNSFYSDSYTYQTALHGWESVEFQLGAPAERPLTVERGFSPRNDRELREDKNTHLSALAVLRECEEVRPPHERFLAIQFFHNPFADVPLCPARWNHKHAHHFRLSAKVPGQFQDWERISSEPRDSENAQLRTDSLSREGSEE